MHIYCSHAPQQIFYYIFGWPRKIRSCNGFLLSTSLIPECLLLKEGFEPKKTIPRKVKPDWKLNRPGGPKYPQKHGTVFPTLSLSIRKNYKIKVWMLNTLGTHIILHNIPMALKMSDKPKNHISRSLVLPHYIPLTSHSSICLLENPPFFHWTPIDQFSSIPLNPMKFH